MTKTTLRKSIEFIVNPNVANPENIHIEWFGGEPLMVPDLLLEATDYAQELAKKYNLKVSAGMVSNMSLLTPELAEKIKRRSIGMLASYDGKLTHNFTRQQGTDRLVRNNIKLALAHGIKIGVAMQVMAGYNHNVFENFLEISELGVSWVALNPVVHSYTRMEDKDWAELERQFALISNYLYEQKMKLGFGKQPLFSWSQMDGQLDAILKVARFGSTGHNGDWSCGACKGSIAIDPEGYIVPCHHMPTDIGYDQWILGHVQEGKINETVRTEFTKTKFEDCSECGVLRCAPCRTVNKGGTGSEFERNPESCMYQRVLFTQAVLLHNRLVDNGYYNTLTKCQHNEDKHRQPAQPPSIKPVFKQQPQPFQQEPWKPQPQNFPQPGTCCEEGKLGGCKRL